VVARLLVNDTGEVDLEQTYTNYHRVKCYDERFAVQVGPTELVEFLGER
jgi:hypothetical protein